MINNFYIYILANKNNSTLYIGMTNNLERRLYEHKNHVLKGFSDKYNTDKLVYVELTFDPESAILREKQLKNWSRKKKNLLIESMNPEWKDLSADWKLKE